MESNNELQNEEKDRIEKIIEQYCAKNYIGQLIKESNLNNPENINKLSEILRSNTDELNVYAESKIWKQIVEECDDFNVREFLISKGYGYDCFIDYSSLNDGIDPYLKSFIVKIVEKYKLKDIIKILVAEGNQLNTALRKMEENDQESTEEYKNKENKLYDICDTIRATIDFISIAEENYEIPLKIDFDLLDGEEEVEEKYIDYVGKIQDYIVLNSDKFVDYSSICNKIGDDILDDKDLEKYYGFKTIALRTLLKIATNYKQKSNEAQEENNGTKHK